jgi:hypothetical protein
MTPEAFRLWGNATPLPVQSATGPSVLIELAVATGITDEHIEAFIAGISDPIARTVARQEYRRPVWLRSHPLINQIGNALEPPVPAAVIDEVFRKAAERDSG